MTDYRLLYEQAVALTEGVDDFVTNMSNLSALIYNTLENVNWAGFYVLRGRDLLLYPFQGRPACTLLPEGRGVCQKSAMTGQIINVKDVHAFAGHIACDSASKSEIVLPIKKAGKVIAVLDIDSPIAARFDEEDEKGLKSIAEFIETLV